LAFGDPVQIIIIGVILVALFLWGPQKIPELARALGRARKEFDSASKEFEGAAGGVTPAAPRTADEILLDTARQLGINTMGKSREQISQEIVARSRPQA
jgi:sec-independent protein translocase protein TatA